MLSFSFLEQVEKKRGLAAMKGGCRDHGEEKRRKEKLEKDNEK
jgi:hypothetical protein